MNKIPTAEEFFEPHHSDDATYGQRHIESLLKEFAQLHVEAALKAAAKKAELAYKRSGYFEQGYLPEVNKESILNAYPKENIK